MSGALQLVDEVTDPSAQISTDQLIAIQNLMGNNSTWWPIKDYTTDEVRSVFNALEMSVVYKDGIPVGIAHLDKAGLANDVPSTKVVFIALDPAVNGKGIGREVLHEMMSRAVDGGAAIVNLDTVLHRDRRSDARTEALAAKSAGSVYEAAGFRLYDAKLINPGDAEQLKAEGLAINQLNGPTEYVSTNFAKLRGEVYQAFGLDVAASLAKVEEFRNERRPAPSPTASEGKQDAGTLAAAKGAEVAPGQKARG